MSSVITVGSVYLDHIIYGITPHSDSRLAFNNIYKGNHGEIVLGGSAVNCAMQLSALGQNTSFIGKVGNDWAGHRVKALFRDKDIDSSLVQVADDHTTSISMVLVHNESAEFMTMNYGSASSSITIEDIPLKHDLLKEADAVYFGGTFKHQLLWVDLPVLLKRLKAAGKLTVLDPNRLADANALQYYHMVAAALPFVDCYLPNESELVATMGKNTLEDALDEAMRLGAKLVVVKLGPNGCRVKTAQFDVHIPAHNIVPVTTVGAGDSFNAAFISSYLENNDPLQAAEFATACAAIKVSENRWPKAHEVHARHIKTVLA